MLLVDCVEEPTVPVLTNQDLAAVADLPDRRATRVATVPSYTNGTDWWSVAPTARLDLCFRICREEHAMAKLALSCHFALDVLSM